MQSGKSDRQYQLDRLKREHRELDEQIAEMERRRVLTDSDEQEIKRLKRLKLAKKDELALLDRDQS